MKLFYIAGPYRAKTVHAVGENIRRAKELGDKVIRLGHYPAIPHKCTEFCEGLADDQFFIDGTMLMMERCDGVVVVDNWEKSTGTRGEIWRANELDMPVFFNLHDLSVWLEDGSFTQTYTMLLNKAIQHIKDINTFKNLSDALATADK